MTDDTQARRVAQFWGGVVDGWKTVVYKFGKGVGVFALLTGMAAVVLSWMFLPPFYITLESHLLLVDLLNASPGPPQRAVTAATFITLVVLWNALATYPIMAGLDRVAYDD